MRLIWHKMRGLLLAVAALVRLQNSGTKSQVIGDVLLPAISYALLKIMKMPVWGIIKTVFNIRSPSCNN